MTKHTHTVRIKQLSGTWRVVNYFRTYAGAYNEAERLHREHRWWVAIFEGRKKVFELGEAA